MSADPVAVLLARALRGLVAYVNDRDEACTADDDVRALEDVASTLSEVPAENVSQLRALVGPEFAAAFGLS